jgi:hypothetical protein
LSSLEFGHWTLGFHWDLGFGPWDFSLMPSIIDYPSVLDQLQQQGLKCLYHNSGAFGFPRETATQSRGWIGPADDSIQLMARSLTRSVPRPYEANLAAMAEGTWITLLPGKVWAMPKSHWAYELQFGSRDWMPALLEKTSIDASLLADRNNAAAIEFTASEVGLFRHFVQQLLEMLHGSDFLLAFPGHQTVCTIHSHKQLWWTTTSPQIAMELDRVL